jgi:hypothetical protein
VEKRRPITEEDVLLTELLIARSFGNLKQSVIRASSRTLSSVGGSVGGTIKKHPYATAGAAVGAGIILFGLFSLLNRRGSASRSVSGSREQTSRAGTAMDLLSVIMPIITPYITAYVEKYMGRMFSRGRY